MPRVTITPAAHAAAGAVDLAAATRLSPKHIVSAVRDGSGDLKVIAWEVGSNGALTRRGDASAGAVSGLAITDWPGGPGVVTAVRTGSGTLKVIAWAVDATGSVQRRGDGEAGGVKDLAVSSPDGFAGVVTPVVNASGKLEVIAWKLSNSGTFTRAETGSGGACTNVAVTALTKAGGTARCAVAVRTGGGNLKLITWGISSSAVTRLGEASAGGVTQIAITARATPNADVITATRGADGNLALIGWTVADDGTLQRISKATGGAASDIAVTTWKPDIHTYVVVALCGQSGELKLIVCRNGADLARHGEILGVHASKVAVSLWGGGVVTSCRDGQGNLRLDSWALQPAGMGLLHAEWPPGAALTIQPEAIEQILASLAKLEPVRVRSYAEPSSMPPTVQKAKDTRNG
jgi:hypothetical protein